MSNVHATARMPWDQYYLNIARAVACRADCTRRQIGAILVNADNRHRGSGYNGSRPGGPSCLAGECPRGRLSTEEVAPGSSYDTGPGTCHAVHAEQNVILDTTPQDRKGGTIYITDVPCDGCLRMLQASGVYRIVWPRGQWILRSAKEWKLYES
jgi:dCMP deaminase